MTSLLRFVNIALQQVKWKNENIAVKRINEQKQEYYQKDISAGPN